MRILREPLFGVSGIRRFPSSLLSVFAETTLSKDGLPPLKAQSGRFLRQNEWYRGNFRLILLYEAFLFCNLCFTGG